MNWKQAKDVIATIQSLVTSIALIIGAVWAYYRFIRFRTLKPRLDFAFDFFSQFNSNHDSCIVIVRFKVSNKGNTRVDLRKDGTCSCILKYGLINLNESTKGVSVISQASKRLVRIDNVFIAHKWIEPNETIDDVKVLNIAVQNRVAIQLEVEIFGDHKTQWFRMERTKWSASTAFPLTKQMSASSFTSEDEQDEYMEAEFAIAALETNLNRARAALLLGDLIERAESLLAELNRRKPAPASLLEQSRKLLVEFNKRFE